MKKKNPSLSQRTTETSLFPIWSIVRQVVKQHIAMWRLPAPATYALLHLHSFPGDAEPARLSECVVVPRQTMSFALDVLEKQGLASRAPHPNDRRKKIVVLSTKGAKLAESIVQDLLKFESAALAAFSPSEHHALRTLSLKFAEALQKVEKSGFTQKRTSMKNEE